jgi:hypothetical protein
MLTPFCSFLYDIIRQVFSEKSAMESNFIIPQYGTHGFTGILPKALEELLNHKYEAVVFFLVDGFGMRFVERFQEAPFLSEITKKGTLQKVVSQFPSTTTSHLATLHTGQPVGEHGIYEWYYYEPTLDMVIAPLLFSNAGTFERDTLKDIGVKPRKVFQQNEFYHILNRQGVQSHIFQHREYTPSSFGDIFFDGARQWGFKTLPEALVNLSNSIAQSPAPSYYMVYYDKIDSISHEYGPESPQTEAEILSFLLTMQSIFLTNMTDSRKKILLLLTADHGQVEVDPNTTIYINQDARFKDLEDLLKKNRKGEMIIPCGSARDFFLHINDAGIEEAVGLLRKELQGKAEVWLVRDMIDQGYFGPTLSNRFLERVGNVVILPYPNESVWWFEKDKFEMRFRGHHGGLSRQEMEIPLISWEL